MVKIHAFDKVSLRMKTCFGSTFFLVQLTKFFVFPGGYGGQNPPKFNSYFQRVPLLSRSNSLCPMTVMEKEFIHSGEKLSGQSVFLLPIN